MNCNLANLVEAIGVVEFLVVASRSVIISMLTRLKFSHFTQSLTMFYDFLITFTSTCIECFSSASVLQATPSLEVEARS